MENQPSQWAKIRSRDDLPTEAGYYLTWDGQYHLACYFNNKPGGGFRGEEIPTTHWMPLPEPPKRESEIVTIAPFAGDMTVTGQKIHALMESLMSQVSKVRCAQENAFVAEHLDKIGTHELYRYPETSAPTETGTAYEEPVALVPKGLYPAGSVLPWSAAEGKGYAVTVIKWRIVTA